MLEVKNLTKIYGKKTVLDNVSFKVRKGETVVIMGPSGCGKSTLVRCINRLVEPDGGTIFFHGVEVNSLKDNDLLKLRRNIGFVFQHFNLIKHLTALDNIVLPLVVHGMERNSAVQKARMVLEQVGLPDKADRFPLELSGGEQQRVGIARALALQPQIMLWDEPTASLDPILVSEVLKVMEELAGQDITMLVVTHELKFALKAADRIILMAEGKITEEGTPQEIFYHPQSLIGQKYKSLLGESIF